MNYPFKFSHPIKKQKKNKKKNSLSDGIVPTEHTHTQSLASNFNAAKSNLALVTSYINFRFRHYNLKQHCIINTVKINKRNGQPQKPPQQRISRQRKAV